MQINIKDPNPPTKFYFDDEKPEKGFVLLRVVPPAESKEFRNQCTTKQPPEYRGHVRFEVPDKINEALLNEKIWDYSLVGWQGLTDENGEPIPVTTENKVFLIQNAPEFTKFVTQSMAVLEANPGMSREEKLKNSPSTSQD